jgi:hypothetical protein
LMFRSKDLSNLVISHVCRGSNKQKIYKLVKKLRISQDELIAWAHTSHVKHQKTTQFWPPIDSREHQRAKNTSHSSETRSTKERRLEREN